MWRKQQQISLMNIQRSKLGESFKNDFFFFIFVVLVVRENRTQCLMPDNEDMWWWRQRLLVSFFFHFNWFVNFDDVPNKWILWKTNHISDEEGLLSEFQWNSKHNLKSWQFQNVRVSMFLWRTRSSTLSCMSWWLSLTLTFISSRSRSSFLFNVCLTTKDR